MGEEVAAEASFARCTEDTAEGAPYFRAHADCQPLLLCCGLFIRSSSSRVVDAIIVVIVAVGGAMVVIGVSGTIQTPIATIIIIFVIPTTITPSATTSIYILAIVIRRDAYSFNDQSIMCLQQKLSSTVFCCHLVMNNRSPSTHPSLNQLLFPSFRYSSDILYALDALEDNGIL